MWLLFSMGSNGFEPSELQLTDGTIRHIINTLPQMVPQLREVGIIVSEAHYIWPRDAALDARGAVLLEQYGYDGIQQNALEIFCQAWFCLNYDSLIHERRKILSTIEEQVTENPYIADEHKRINIRILNKELGHTREQLLQNVGCENLHQMNQYSDKIKQAWETLRE
jgi:hypothetical protein